MLIPTSTTGAGLAVFREMDLVETEVLVASGRAVSTIQLFGSGIVDVVLCCIPRFPMSDLACSANLSLDHHVGEASHL